MKDRQLHRFFVQVIEMQHFDIPNGITMIFSLAETDYLKTLWNGYCASDALTRRDANDKGYTVEDGDTLSFQEMLEIASKTSYCPISKVKVLFDMSGNDDNQPLVFSLNRIRGFDGPRTKPTHKYPHSINNVEGCCRAVNLAQNYLGTEEVQKWVKHIQDSPKDIFLYEQ